MDQSVLALIDTSRRIGWFGLSCGGSIIRQQLLDPNRGHARDLSNAISIALHETGLAVSSIAAVAVNIGPGSFTGIRVALATVKAIAYATRVRLIACDTFDLTARGFAEMTEDFRVVVDFQLNSWLVCDFARREDGSWQRGEVQIIADINELAASTLPLCGPGLEKAMRQGAAIRSLHEGPWEPRREAFLEIALERIDSNRFEDPFTVEPVYASMSSAERLWLSQRKTPNG